MRKASVAVAMVPILCVVVIVGVLLYYAAGILLPQAWGNFLAGLVWGNPLAIAYTGFLLLMNLILIAGCGFALAIPCWNIKEGNIF